MELKDLNNKKVLENLFDVYAEELYENTDTNRKLVKQILTMEEELLNELTEEQKERFDSISNLKSMNDSETDKNIFIYTFSLAVQLMLECIS